MSALLARAVSQFGRIRLVAFVRHGRSRRTYERRDLVSSRKGEGWDITAVTESDWHDGLRQERTFGQTVAPNGLDPLTGFGIRSLQTQDVLQMANLAIGE